jgi:iron complex transport system ATP-binding protein
MTVQLRCVRAGYAADGAARHEVLHGIDLDAAPGSITAILGPNGVGKTTLLNVALGWIAPWSGTVSVSGRPLAGIPGPERGRLVSLVPQSDHIPFEYSILEYVLLGRAPYIAPMELPTAGDHEIARAALDRVGIGAMADHGVLETSAGERQLVLLARALAQEPQALLLDEPSAHLDLANKRRLVGLLRAQSQLGRAVVLTVHEPEFAAAVATDVVLLREGRVLAAGPPEAVLTSDLLSRLYDIPVRVHRTGDGPLFAW